MTSIFRCFLGSLAAVALTSAGVTVVQADPAAKPIELAQAAGQSLDGTTFGVPNQKKKPPPKKKPANAKSQTQSQKPAAKKVQTKPAAKPVAQPKTISKPPNATSGTTFSAPGSGSPSTVKKVQRPPTVKSSPAPKVVKTPEPKRVAPVQTMQPKTRQLEGTTFAAPMVKKPTTKRPPPDVVKRSYTVVRKPARKYDDLKRERKEEVLGGGKYRVIREPDRRTIVRQDNRIFIRSDESERFRRISPSARSFRRSDGSYQTVMTRRDGGRIVDVVDRNGRLLYRTRRGPGGRETILIDNRRYYREERNSGRDLLLGVGIGLVAGAAIVALSEPRVTIPRERYIVDYDRASDDDIYEALTAPPVERLDRSYSLDEIRYSRPLRDRMRRVDLDTVTFDFGSWEVGADQERALERMAAGINRALESNADEIFLIEGHTDAVGSDEDNLSLSDRRAQSVAEILTTAYGVPPENLVTQGYGEEYLKINTQEPERANRRIAVRRISPLLSENFRDEQPE